MSTAIPRTAWVDWVAVDRAVNGEPVGRALTIAEIAEALPRLDKLHLSPTEIARRLHLHPRTIRNLRRKLAT
jgi:hypothetical protein